MPAVTCSCAFHQQGAEAAQPGFAVARPKLPSVFKRGFSKKLEIFFFHVTPPNI
jgi:hypothetical protein